MFAGLALGFFVVAQGAASGAGGDQPKPESIQPDPAWRTLGPSLWFDPNSKRLHLRARVVLREGYLEHLMCSKGTKEHEAILATDAEPYRIHAGLLMTGAKPGHPVRFVPKFEPPAGSAVSIELSWKQDGKIQRSDARQWIKDEKNAPLSRDWVFAGSQFYEDPATKKQLYAANEGDLVTVANFGSAILDLPIASSANDAERAFSTNTVKIPPVGTEVFVSLGPRPARAEPKAASGAARSP
jgi:hypothetical protein